MWFGLKEWVRIQKAGESIHITCKEVCSEKFSLIFSTQHAFGDRWSFQVLCSVSIYIEKYTNLLLHSLGVRFKHLFQITDTINILETGKPCALRKWEMTQPTTLNWVGLGQMSNKKKKERKKSVPAATGKQLMVIILLSGNTVKIYCCSVLSCLVMSNSLRPHGLYPTRLLCPQRFIL